MRFVGKSLTVAAVAATLLASCSTSTDAEAPPATAPLATETTTPEAEETRTQEPTPEVIEATVGDLVTEEEAELLPEGQTAYPLDSGELVVVDINEPLPEVLVQEVYDKISAEADAELAAGGGGSTVDAWRQANDIGKATGRHVIFVAKGHAFTIDGEVEATFWSLVASGSLHGETHSDFTRYSREDAIARAEDLAAENEGYEVIVHEG